MDKIFNTDRRIRLGIWGLGRGANFIESAKFLNIDVVAGCDINPDMRESFRNICPDAFITANEDEFLARKDVDAVLIATFFPSHAEHTLKALAAGKHIMCEVTSFFTPAEGVEVIEAVEKSGKVYNLLENYPFTRENLFLQEKWQEGFFGEFMYGEFEYLHNCRTLSYGYNIPGTPPIEPGNCAHSWRSWLNFHYYNTHSLGPVMKITGLRPIKVAAPPVETASPGFLPGSKMDRACPSMITMSNGGVVRNLTGAVTADYHTTKRIWGTRAAAESLGYGLKIWVGAGGNDTFRMSVNPPVPELGKYAENAGHGGSDFWELYYFAREILTGEKAPWDIYDACDITLAGIMAVKSQHLGGAVLDIPDFRDASVREQYRNDNWTEEHIDPDRIFPDNSDESITSAFCRTMIDLENNLKWLRRTVDGMKMWPHLTDDASRLDVLRAVSGAISKLPEWIENFERASALMQRYPDCPAGAALKSMLALGLPEMLDPEALKQRLNQWCEQMTGSRSLPKHHP